MAGIRVGSLYQYFPNKEALVAALIDQHIASMWALFQAKGAELREASMPLEQGVQLLIKTMLEAESVGPRLHKALLEQVPRVGGLDGLNAFTERLIAMTQAVLDLHNKSEAFAAELGALVSRYLFPRAP